MRETSAPAAGSPCRDIDELRGRVGRELHVGDWIEIGQDRIDTFARATGDFQWIHVDPERAQRESPFGGTIAHGFLTLSLLAKDYEDFMPVLLPFCDVGLNYGLDRVRFTQPVRAGSRVRNRFTLSKVDEVPGGVQMVFTATVEIEGAQRPACVAQSVVRRQFRQDHQP